MPKYTRPPAAPYGEDTRPSAARTPAAEGHQTRPLAAPNPKREDPEGEPHTAPLGTPSGAHVFAPIDVLFEEFWSAFPHRPGDPKREARAVFREIIMNSGVEPALLIERAQAHTANVEELEVRYWMHAVTWLREECWCDQAVHPIRGQGIVAAAREMIARSGPLRSRDEPPAGEARAAPLVSETEWREMLTEFAATNRLSSTWLAMFPGRGLPPQSNATRVPVHICEEFGFAK
jgi:hypothetical protein